MLESEETKWRLGVEPEQAEELVRIQVHSNILDVGFCPNSFLFSDQLNWRFQCLMTSFM